MNSHTQSAAMTASSTVSAASKQAPSASRNLNLTKKVKSMHQFSEPVQGAENQLKQSKQTDMATLVAESGFDSNRELTCGVLGGLGPEATVNFLSCIIRKTAQIYGASSDQDHVHVVVEMNPKVPNRNHAIHGEGEDCGPALKSMSENLVRAQCDFVVCACNTAHAFEKDIVEGCGDVPFVSMIEVCSNKVLENILFSKAPKKCGILGGGGCIDAGLFQKSLLARGVEPVVPCSENQTLLQDIIYRIKAGDKGEKVIEDFIILLKELKEEHNCSQIILGCTELPIIIGQCLQKYDSLQESDLVDSCEVMVEAVVKLAKRDLNVQQVLDYPTSESEEAQNFSLDYHESTQPSEDDKMSPMRYKEAATCDLSSNFQQLKLETN